MKFLLILVFLLNINKYKFHLIESINTSTVNTTELNNTLVPEIIYEFELFNLEDNTEYLKWASLYKYKEDNSYIIEITTKKKIYSTNAFVYIFERTADGIVFDSEDFQNFYLILIDPEKTKTRIIGSGYEIIVTKSPHPFYVSVYKKTGFWKEEKIRGFILDWKEYQILLSRSSQLMKDANI